MEDRNEHAVLVLGAGSPTRGVHVPEPVLQVDVETHGELAVCHLSGELDAYSAPRFREAISGLCSFPLIAVDLSGVPFIDSAGLAALVCGVRRIREVGGRVALYAPRRNVGHLICIAGFDRVAPLLGDLAEAKAELLLEPAGA